MSKVKTKVNKIYFPFWIGQAAVAQQQNPILRFKDFERKKKRFASVVSLARSSGTRYLEIERKIYSSSKDGRKLNKKLKCKKMFVVLLCCAPNKIDFCLPRWPYHPISDRDSFLRRTITLPYIRGSLKSIWFQDNKKSSSLYFTCQNKLNVNQSCVVLNVLHSVIIEGKEWSIMYQIKIYQCVMYQIIILRAS